MSIGRFKIEVYIEKLIRQAEHLANENLIISTIIDKAFDELGKASGSFIEMQNQLGTMMRMLRAWYAREYNELSPKAVASLIASAVYIVNPIDLIPDFIPFVGRLDDKLVLGYFIKKFNNEIQKFMAWEDSQPI